MIDFPRPSIDLALSFWRALSGHEEAPATLQFFDDIEARRAERKLTKTPDPLAVIRYGSLRLLWPMVEQLQAQGAGVFYTINHCDGKGRHAKNITALRAAACDHDNDPPASLPFDPARVNPGAPPSIVVNSSPGNYQSLWRLADGEPLNEWSPLHKEHLIPHFQSDKHISDLPRVFRLPGTLHQKKYPDVHLVTFAAYDVARTFTIADLRTAYPRSARSPAPALPSRVGDVVSGPVDPDLEKIFGPHRAAGLTTIAHNWPAPGARHAAQFALAGALCAEFPAPSAPDEPDLALEALKAVCRIAGDEDPVKRADTIDRTRARIAAGEPNTGWTTLSQFVPSEAVERARKFFGKAAEVFSDDFAEALAKNIAPAPRPLLTGGSVLDAWTQLIVRDTKGRPLGSLGNTITTVQCHPAWQNLLAYNTRSMKIVLQNIPWPREIDDGRPLPRYVDESDGGRAATWLSHTQQMSVSSGQSIEAMLCVAKRNAFDPVVDALDDLPEWDHEKRLERLLRDYAGAQTPDLLTSIYYSIVGKRYMVQAVARAYRPGCQADMMLILEGPQGVLKSTWLRTLFMDDEFFSDQMPPIDTKDAKQHVHGPWGIEMPELAAAGKARVEAIKAFITLRDDNFRHPYQRVEERIPRGCVFAGTINPDENGYLKDHTGARRFFPVLCTGKLDIEGLRRDRDQIWAEAVHLYRNPDRREVSWLTYDEMRMLAAPQQEMRTEADALEEKIARAVSEGVRNTAILGGLGGNAVGQWLIQPGTVDTSVAEIMAHVCADRGDLGPALQQRVGRVLKRMGWERYAANIGGARVWRYRRRA